MVSRKAKIAIAILRALPIKKEYSIEKKRHILNKIVSTAKIPKDIIVESIKINNKLYAEWIYHKNADMDKTILYLHGGAYTVGSPKTHRPFVARVAKLTNMKVLLIDYRLAPENPFPAALEDAIMAYKWLVDNIKKDPTKIVIMGDSAGGGLTLSTMVKLREENIALPYAAVCYSPWVDLSLSGESVKTKEETDPQLSKMELSFAAEMYLQGESPRNPLASPLYANLQGLPPLLIQCGTTEILMDDSIRITRKAKEQGVKVKLEIFEGMTHCFQLFGESIPESKKALHNMVKFLNTIEKEIITVKNV